MTETFLFLFILIELGKALMFISLSSNLYQIQKESRDIFERIEIRLDQLARGTDRLVFYYGRARIHVYERIKRKKPPQDDIGIPPGL